MEFLSWRLTARAAVAAAADCHKWSLRRRSGVAIPSDSQADESREGVYAWAGSGAICSAAGCGATAGGCATTGCCRPELADGACIGAAEKWSTGGAGAGIDCSGDIGTACPSDVFHLSSGGMSSEMVFL